MGENKFEFKPEMADNQSERGDPGAAAGNEKLRLFFGDSREQVEKFQVRGDNAF